MLTFSIFAVFSINDVTPSLFPVSIRVTLPLLLLFDNSATNEGDGGSGRQCSSCRNEFLAVPRVIVVQSTSFLISCCCSSFKNPALSAAQLIVFISC